MLRVVDEETLGRLEGGSDGGVEVVRRSGSVSAGRNGDRDREGAGVSNGNREGAKDGDGCRGGGGRDNREEMDIELEEIPISPLPGVWIPGRPSALGRQADEWQLEEEEYTEYYQQQREPERKWGRGPEQVHQQQQQQQQEEQKLRETRGVEKGASSRARITRWPGVWGIGSGSGSGSGSRHGRHTEEVDGQSISSKKNNRRGGFRARSTRLFSTVGAWLNGIDDGRSQRSSHRHDQGDRYGNRRGVHQWDSAQWDMV